MYELLGLDFIWLTFILKGFNVIAQTDGIKE